MKQHLIYLEVWFGKIRVQTLGDIGLEWTRNFFQDNAFQVAINYPGSSPFEDGARSFVIKASYLLRL